MPRLIWNEKDFAACLEVLPQVEEDGDSYTYQVCKNSLRLDLSVFPYASEICISIFQEGVEQPVLDLKIRDCPGAKYVSDERGEFLEFAPGDIFGGRFDEQYVIPIGIRLSVKPSISLRFF